MLRTIVVATLTLTLFANIARAEEPPIVAGHTPSAPIQASIAQVRFETAAHSLPAASLRSTRRNGPAQKVTAGFAMGLLGLLGGTAIGASLDRHCGCDDPGLRGGLIGASIGAAGAIAGVVLASR